MIVYDISIIIDVIISSAVNKWISKLIASATVDMMKQKDER